MKTVRFDHMDSFPRSAILSNRKYICSESGDQSGSYVPEEKVKALVEALRKIASGYIKDAGDIMGFRPASIDELKGIAQNTLKKVLIELGHSERCAARQVSGDGECECDGPNHESYAWML